jgi:hypothetical protein
MPSASSSFVSLAFDQGGLQRVWLASGSLEVTQVEDVVGSAEDIVGSAEGVVGSAEAVPKSP